jgi:hypothetical protein
MRLAPNMPSKLIFQGSKKDRKILWLQIKLHHLG